jgi:hypothetical protein
MIIDTAFAERLLLSCVLCWFLIKNFPRLARDMVVVMKMLEKLSLN